MNINYMFSRQVKSGEWFTWMQIICKDIKLMIDNYIVSLEGITDVNDEKNKVLIKNFNTKIFASISLFNNFKKHYTEMYGSVQGEQDIQQRYINYYETNMIPIMESYENLIQPIIDGNIAIYITSLEDISNKFDNLINSGF